MQAFLHWFYSFNDDKYCNIAFTFLIENVLDHFYAEENLFYKTANIGGQIFYL